MTTFKLDADFRHPLAEVTPTPRNGSGVHVRFLNGWVVSIQWGPGTYSDNHQRWDLPHDSPDLTSEKAEVAAWHGEGGMIGWPDGDTVQGWKTWDEVQAVLDQAEAGTLATAKASA